MFTDAVPEDETRFLRIAEVRRLVPVSRNTIYRLMDKGDFPKAVRIGSVSLWDEQEVRAYMRGKVESR